MGKGLLGLAHPDAPATSALQNIGWVVRLQYKIKVPYPAKFYSSLTLMQTSTVLIKFRIRYLEPLTKIPTRKNIKCYRIF
jgi:hypothetical protein